MFRFILLFAFLIGSANADTLRILSWNVFMLPKPIKNSLQKERTKEISNELALTSHDVLVFQEAFSGRFRKQVKKNMGQTHPYTYYLKKKSFFSIFGSGLFMVSRYPFEVLDHIYYSTCSGSDCYASKGALLVRVKLPTGKSVQIMTTHLQSKREAAEDRRSQVEEIKVVLNQHRNPQEPLIFLGDLNIDSTDPEFEWSLSTLGLKNLELVGPIQKTSSLVNPCFKTGDNPKWVDHIWYRNLPATSSLTMRVKPFVFEKDENFCPLSDHHAVEAELTI
jgi:endonuclease/exonuclease/phosphatase family metal-dependent hydrolase